MLNKKSLRDSRSSGLGGIKAPLLFVALAVCAWSVAVAGGASMTRANPAVETPSAGVVENDEPEEVTLTLRPQGITPRRVVRRAGRFLLSVDNRTEAEKLVLRIEDSNGTSLRVLEIPPTAIDWNVALDLTPGEYRLVEVDHPDWECFIEIKAGV